MFGATEGTCESEVSLVAFDAHMTQMSHEIVLGARRLLELSSFDERVRDTYHAIT